MAIDYDKMRATADRLIGENGSAAILRRKVESAYDPLTDTITETEVDYAINVVLSKVRSRDHDYDVEFIDKTYEGQALTKLTISAEGLAVSPEPGDQVIVAGQTWIVAGSNPVRPDGYPVVHICYGVQ